MNTLLGAGGLLLANTGVAICTQHFWLAMFLATCGGISIAVLVGRADNNASRN